MPFLPPDDSPERILLFGGPGAGKSYAWAGIADMYVKTKTDGRFWIIDNDFGAKRMLREFPEVKDIATLWTPRSFDEYRDITHEVMENAEPNDWIVIDLISNVWEMMPGWWMENVYGEDSWGYWVSVRREVVEAQEAGKSDSRQFGGAAGVDWIFIKKAYFGWERQMTKDAPCHVIALAAEKEVVSHFDKTGEKSARYSGVGGMQPVSEKLTPHRFHTEMRLACRLGPGGRSVASRELTMVKDRQREDVWDEIGGRGRTIELTHGPRFAMDYLKKIGGWKIGKG